MKVRSPSVEQYDAQSPARLKVNPDSQAMSMPIPNVIGYDRYSKILVSR